MVFSAAPNNMGPAACFSHYLCPWVESLSMVLFYFFVCNVMCVLEVHKRCRYGNAYPSLLPKCQLSMQFYFPTSILYYGVGRKVASHDNLEGIA
jgi:hypothetical protein